MTHQLLCDIGNTNFNFSDGRSVDVEQFDISSIDERVYYISVNQYWEKRLSMQDNWVNLRSFIDFESYYPSMGIDRIMCCEAVDSAVIVDAGSAITVDLVQNGKHQGGFIYPGLRALQKCYKDISPALEVSFNFDIDLAKMPKNTEDALSYGAIVPLLSHIRSLSNGLPVIFTGGDAEKLLALMPEATLDREIVFKGMQKLLEGKA